MTKCTKCQIRYTSICSECYRAVVEERDSLQQRVNTIYQSGFDDGYIAGREEGIREGENNILGVKVPEAKEFVDRISREERAHLLFLVYLDGVELSESDWYTMVRVLPTGR